MEPKEWCCFCGRATHERNPVAALTLGNRYRICFRCLAGRYIWEEAS